MACSITVSGAAFSTASTSALNPPLTRRPTRRAMLSLITSLLFVETISFEKNHLCEIHYRRDALADDLRVIAGTIRRHCHLQDRLHQDHDPIREPFLDLDQRVSIQRVPR